MAQLSVGEDLFSTLVAVGLISLFVLALAHVCRAHEARGDSQEGFELALSVAEQLKNHVPHEPESGPRLGLIVRTDFERALPSFSELLAERGVGVRVEIRSLEWQQLFAHGPEPATRSSSVSLPVAFVHAGDERKLSWLVVWAWRD